MKLNLATKNENITIFMEKASFYWKVYGYLTQVAFYL